jgi:hypothetical protein
MQTVAEGGSKYMSPHRLIVIRNYLQVLNLIRFHKPAYGYYHIALWGRLMRWLVTPTALYKAFRFAAGAAATITAHKINNRLLLF